MRVFRVGWRKSLLRPMRQLRTQSNIFVVFKTTKRMVFGFLTGLTGLKEPFLLLR